MEIKRRAYYQILEILKNKQIPILLGLRRTGKTTILKQLNKKLEKSIYITFDDFFISSWTDIEVWNHLMFLANKYDYILVDEIQVRPKWDLMLKNFFDKFIEENKCKIVATGSSSINLVGKEMGVNRTKRIYLNTWDFDEYLSLTKEKKSFEAFEKFLNTGFPDYMIYKKSEHNKLNELLKPILQHDIPKAYPQINTLLLMRFMKELSLLTNGEINESSLCQKVGIQRTTLKNYMEILSRACLIKIIYKVDERLIMPKKKVYKVYINSHLHIWLLNKPFKEIDNKYKGHIIESYWLHWATSLNGWSKTFYYLKDKNAQEIDFISLDNNSIKTLHEFKYCNNKNPNSLFYFLDAKNKIIWGKETKEENGIKFISILDINDN